MAKNKIDKLIEKFCPSGVVYKELSALGNFYGGLTGKNKEDFSNGTSKYVTYMNVYSNLSVNTEVDDYVKLNSGEKQNAIEYGDILFTGSSETPDECGMSSVLTTKLSEPLYLNSFCFGFRLNDISLFNPEFLKHLFRDNYVRKQIANTASGVTRFNVSKKRFAKIKIPVPPLEIQDEIVKILNKFTELEAELEAELEVELEARKKQYNYYQKALLSPADGIKFRKLSEIAKVTIGEFVHKNKQNPNGKYPVFNGGTNETGYYDNFNNAGNKIIISARGANAGFVNKIFRPYWAGNSCYSVEILDKDLINWMYIFYYLKSNQNKLIGEQQRGGIPAVSKKQVENFEIPMIKLPEQNRVVATLDKLDALVNDISIGLPAELKARRQQYEYYRNKLLTFKEYAD